ncbi:class I SAM-dependent methyltransferase [Shinella zoogloeoides]|uniref:class I SAM-dependent methyltransferase n=1 Tax=Shinella zoogloeoides TaxID=352475 RepID=UPI001F56820A|nr:class I SAM-dependent methyltransferase [Shinella zoogloeoides]
MNMSSFYHEFEAHFRGTRQEIQKRLEVYIPFLEPLLNASDRPRIVDVGCGRGEWLELTSSIGMDAHGVDLDEGMLQDCWDRGLSADKADAIAYLASLPADSLAVVSGFHIAEHLPFEALQALIANALRVLQPGGLLILETPNAENIHVGSLTFHMDPTHVKPLPPGLLSFLPRFHGFQRAKVLRLQENKELAEADTTRLLDVFQGVSPDYAVVAQKSGEPAYLHQWDGLFDKEFGLTLDTLSHRFEQGFHDRISAQGEQIQDLQRQLDGLARQNSDYQYQLTDYQERLEAVYNSTSWRITQPLRAATLRLRDARQAGARELLTRLARRILRPVVLLVLSNKHARALGHRVVSRYPSLASRLKRLITPPLHASQASFAHSLSQTNLTPKARLIYAKLKKAVDSKHNG